MRKGTLNSGRIWVPVFMMAGISILSGGSAIQLGPVNFLGIDKLGHFIVFGLLGIAWARSINFRSPPHPGYWVIAVVLTIAYGLLDEWHQLYNPDRYFEWADLGADFAGALFFSGIYLRIEVFRKVMEHKFC